MKKLFISCPMNGRTPEDILDSRNIMHKIAELLWGEELEVIASFVPNAVPSEAASSKHAAVFCLAHSIRAMANADCFIGVDSYDFRGCSIEREVARAYDIPMHVLPADLVIPHEESERQAFERWRARRDAGLNPYPMGIG